MNPRVDGSLSGALAAPSMLITPLRTLRAIHGRFEQSPRGISRGPSAACHRLSTIRYDPVMDPVGWPRAQHGKCSLTRIPECDAKYLRHASEGRHPCGAFSRVDTPAKDGTPAAQRGKSALRRLVPRCRNAVLAHRLRLRHLRTLPLCLDLQSESHLRTHSITHQAARCRLGRLRLTSLCDARSR